MSSNIRVVHSSDVNKDCSDSASLCSKLLENIRVLIVDDDKDSGESLRDIIKYRGHDVTLLDEGMKFVNRMNEEEFDIIFMDYHTNDFPEHIKPNKLNKSDKESELYDSDNSSDSRNSDKESDNANQIRESITGTYVTKLARECYDFETPVYAYTGDNSNEAIEDFKNSHFKGVFVKPVDSLLINTFFEIIEKETINREDNDNITKSKSLINLSNLSKSTNSKLHRLSTKNKHFIFFGKKRENK